MRVYFLFLLQNFVFKLISVIFDYIKTTNTNIMTIQETNKLKREIKLMIDSIGFNWLNTSWLDKLSLVSKQTLKEYVFDAKTLSRRDVAIMLYNDEDSKLWNIIMS